MKRYEMGFVGGMGGTGTSKPVVESSVPARPKPASFQDEIDAHELPGAVSDFRRTEKQLQTTQEIASHFATGASLGDENLAKEGYYHTRAGLHDLGIQVETAPKSYTEQQNESEGASSEVSSNTGEPLVINEAEAVRRLDFLKQEMSEVRAAIIAADLKGDAEEKDHLMNQLNILVRSKKRIEDSQKTS